jgi:hypothetical protein
MTGVVAGERTPTMPLVIDESAFLNRRQSRQRRPGRIRRKRDVQPFARDVELIGAGSDEYAVRRRKR